MKKLTEVLDTVKDVGLSYTASYQIDLKNDFNNDRQIYNRKGHITKAEARKLLTEAEKAIRANLFNAQRIYVDVRTGYGPHSNILLELSIKPNHGWGVSKNL